ncbi:MAG: protein-L-isoaspartate(D-aspartate) O-methyltransferase [Planctomycetes bacterium]|nr:protein-L-isoaspartate(D-aspartate) O-methyltransferase [Planctomycetota bacterium]
MRPPEDQLAARRRMVEHQLRARGIEDERILEAFMRIPRERFVPPGRAREAYADYPVAIGFGQTISQPYVVALMIRRLDPRPNWRVLDVGAGSGYQAALLAGLVERVFAVERIAELADRAAETLRSLGIDNVTVRQGDGSMGLPDEAPFDGIICGAAGPEICPSWLDQLADGGRIVAPIGGRDVQKLIVVERRGDEFRRREVCDVRFVRLVGRQGWPR